MKRIFALLLIMLLCLSISSCSKNDTASEGEEDYAAEVTETEVTFKEATEKGTSIWYTTESIEGRNTIVDGVYYFKDGKVTAYIPRLFGPSYEGQMGTLEDYYKLSDEEALSLAKERFESFYKGYVDIANSPLEKSIIEEYEGRYDEIPDWDEQKAAYDAAIEDLKNATAEEKAPVTFDYVMTVDDSGNSCTGEGLRFEYGIEKTYSGQLDSYAGGYSLYEVIEPYALTTYLIGEESVAPFEVSDSFFGGYSGAYSEERVGETKLTRTIYMLRKCDAGTSFVLDQPGTDGIEILK